MTKGELVENHWEYVAALLKTHGVAPDVIKVVEFHYKTAFIHGMKHQKEEGR